MECFLKNKILKAVESIEEQKIQNMQEKLNYLCAQSCNKKATWAFPFKSSSVNNESESGKGVEEVFQKG